MPSSVYSYVVVSDSGFSPNPFQGICTLACCKPKIRSTAKVGDLIVGLSRRCTHIVYMVRISEILDFASYWKDPRFRAKRPQWGSKDPRKRRGDNIYEPLPGGGFRQLPSNHWDHDRGIEDERNKEKDTGTDSVLMGDNFVYFGGSGPALPDHMGFLRVSRGHRCHFSPDQVEEVERYFLGAPRGVQGNPGLWPKTDPNGKAPSCG